MKMQSRYLQSSYLNIDARIEYVDKTQSVCFVISDVVGETCEIYWVDEEVELSVHGIDVPILHVLLLKHKQELLVKFTCQNKYNCLQKSQNCLCKHALKYYYSNVILCVRKTYINDYVI